MSRKRKIKNFHSRLDYACGSDELRPWTNYIHFRNGYAFASDSHCMVMQDLTLSGFTPDDIKLINGQSIHKKMFMQLFKSEYVNVTEHGFDDGTVIFKFKKIDSPDFVKHTDDILKYKRGSRNYIQLKNKILERVLKCMISENGVYKFSFCIDQNHPVFITTRISKQIAIIMPNISDI